MKQNFLILLLAAAALSSCDDDTVTPVQPQTTESKPMSFTVMAKDYQDPNGMGTRSGISALSEDVDISLMLSNGILLSCYNVTGDSVLFSNYIYSEIDGVGSFTDENGEAVDTPMWPGSDKVIFYAYYNGGGYYYFHDDGEIYDYTIQKSDAGHWCFGMNNSNMNGGADFMACIDTTSCDEGATVQLKLQHILTKFMVTAQRAATTDSIYVTSFSVYFPDTVVYDFNEGKVMRIDGVTNTDSIKASPYPVGLDANGFSAYQYEAGYYEDNGTEYAASISSYNQSVVLTKTSGDNYWYLAVPDSLVFDFGYQLIYATTAWVDKTGHLIVTPTAGQKISYIVTLPGQSSTTIDEGTVGTGAN